jgi:hypothetical protein
MYRPARWWFLLALATLLGGLSGTAQSSETSPNEPTTPPGTGAPLAATVLGEEVRTDDAGEVQAIVLGPEPLDAYRRYLEEREEAGDFVIHERTFADAFWRYFTDDAMHSFYESGSQAEARAFAVAPWYRSSEDD